MYYPCSENKDADQLRGYREADLRLCFRPCKLLVFSRTGSNVRRKKYIDVIAIFFFFFFFFFFFQIRFSFLFTYLII